MAPISPSTSPPRTPNDIRTGAQAFAPRKSATPSSDDSIEDLSFDYIIDENGKYLRISKGSSKGSPQSYTPPTPPDDAIEHKELKKPPSPVSLNSPLQRSSLSRSESAYSVLETTSSAVPERFHRSFGRTTSGPVLSNTPSYAAPTSSSAAKPRTAARRIALDEASEKNDFGTAVSRSRPAPELPPHSHLDEKENISETDENAYQASAPGKRRRSPTLPRSTVRTAMRPPLSSTRGADAALRAAQARQAGTASNRPVRMVKSVSTSAAPKSDRYNDTDVSENEYGHSPSSASAHSDGNALAGSALSGLDSDEDAEFNPQNVPFPSSSASSRQRNHPVGTAAAPNPLNQSGNRPRRSASLTEGLAPDDYQLQVQQQQYVNGHSRPGTSLSMGIINEDPVGPKRIPVRERDQHEAEILSDCEKYIRESEAESSEREPSSRQSPSPTHLNVHQARLAHGHRRRDSDTLRSGLPSTSGSPTVVDHLARVPSKSGHFRASPPSSRASQGKISPSGSGLKTRVSPKGRTSPPITRGRLSPPGNSSAMSSNKEPVKLRRTPTAPEFPTANDLANSSAPEAFSGKADEQEEDYNSERERMGQVQSTGTRQASPPPAYTTQPSLAAMVPSMALPGSMRPIDTRAPPPPMQTPRVIVVNKKPYARLDLIGKGGSSRVFRVMSPNNSELYAIKRVSLDRTDSEMMSGYMNEIALLKRLEGNHRIIRLIDSEVRAGPGGTKGHLLLVMECGEVDLAKLLQDQMRNPLNMVWVAYYWQQMLQAVHVIHEEKIVHSDLKPANFVLVRGQLKLIDFGIANAIANDTTNIQREHQVGTINYMSPEAIELPDGMRRLKVGRPSDIWSLGVILYQMIYGQPPFQHLPFLQKMRAIPNQRYAIEFPEFAIPTIPGSKSVNGEQITPPTKLEHLKCRVRADVIESIKKCLTRNSRERVTIPELLEHGWLSMKESELNAPVKPQLAHDETIINPYYMRQLLQYGIKIGAAQGESMDPDTLLKEAERLVAELKGLHT